MIRTNRNLIRAHAGRIVDRIRNSGRNRERGNLAESDTSTRNMCEAVFIKVDRDLGDIPNTSKTVALEVRM